MDGGQSLRRVAMRDDRHEDPRKYASKYLLSEEEVDVFKHDVKARAPRKKKKVRLWIYYVATVNDDSGRE